MKTTPPKYTTLSQAQEAGRAIIQRRMPESIGHSFRAWLAYCLLPRRDKILVSLVVFPDSYSDLTEQQRASAGLPANGFVRERSTGLNSLPDLNPAPVVKRTAASMRRQLLVNAVHDFFQQAGSAQLATGLSIEDSPAGQTLLQAKRRLDAICPPVEYKCECCGWIGSVLSLRHYNHRASAKQPFNYVCPGCSKSADAQGNSALVEQISADDLAMLALEG